MGLWFDFIGLVIGTQLLSYGVYIKSKSMGLSGCIIILLAFYGAAQHCYT